MGTRLMMYVVVKKSCVRKCIVLALLGDMGSSLRLTLSQKRVAEREADVVGIVDWLDF